MTAYGSADATATPSSLLQQNPEWFILMVLAYPGFPGIKAVKGLLHLNFYHASYACAVYAMVVCLSQAGIVS